MEGSCGLEDESEFMTPHVGDITGQDVASLRAPENINPAFGSKIDPDAVARNRGEAEHVTLLLLAILPEKLALPP